MSNNTQTQEKNTRQIKVGNIVIGGGAPIVVQSMAATRTQDLEATKNQVKLLQKAGAGLIRIAVDSKKDVAALAEIREFVPEANLVVDLQESYRLIKDVAPYVDKVRYNPGHLYHHEKNKPVADKKSIKAIFKDTLALFSHRSATPCSIPSL